MTLTRAWIALIVFSALVSAIAAFPDFSGLALAVLVLLLSYLKGRIVLDHYLGLRHARTWQRYFSWSLGAFLLLCLALYAWTGPV